MKMNINLNKTIGKIAAKASASAICAAVIAASSVVAFASVPEEPDYVEIDTSGIESSYTARSEPMAAEDELPEEEVVFEEWQLMNAAANEKYNVIMKEWRAVYGERVYPSYYCGSYINSEQQLVIKVTEITDELKEYFASLIDMTNVVFEEAEYTYNEILAALDEINANWFAGKGSDPFLAAICSTGIADDENAVTVWITDSDPEVAAILYDEELLWETVGEKLTSHTCVRFEIGEFFTDIAEEDSFDCDEAQNAVEFETPDTPENYGIMLLDSAAETSPATGAAFALASLALAGASAVLTRRKG